MNIEEIKKNLIPVGIGFVVVALILAVLKAKFGIEIGDPVDLPETGDPADEAAAS